MGRVASFHIRGNSNPAQLGAALQKLSSGLEKRIHMLSSFADAYGIERVCSMPRHNRGIFIFLLP